MFGEEAGPKIAQITANMDEFDKILGLVANKDNYLGSMQKEFDEVSNTTANAMVLMENSFGRIANAIESVFLPPLASGLKIIADISSSIAIFLEKSPLISGITLMIPACMALGKAIGIVVASWGALKTLFFYPFQLIFGLNKALAIHKIRLVASTIATKAYTLAMGGASLATKAWGIATSAFSKLFKVSMWSVKGALLSTGIGALIVGIGLAIASVCENWESIAPKLIAVWEWIKEAISPITEWFMDIFDFIGKGIDKILSGARAVTDFLGITDSDDTPASLDTNGVVEKTIHTQTQNAQNFYNNTQNRAINDNKTIYINTTASANEVAEAINAYSYSYAD